MYKVKLPVLNCQMYGYADVVTLAETAAKLMPVFSRLAIIIHLSYSCY